jgi:hypothetical protein
MRYSFKNLRNNAKRRGIAFTLTFAQFQQFCYLTDYMAGKGRSSESYSIDRIDNKHGYHWWNIDSMPKGANSSKGTKVLDYNYRTGYARYRTFENGNTDFLF